MRKGFSLHGLEYLAGTLVDRSLLSDNDLYRLNLARHILRADVEAARGNPLFDESMRGTQRLWVLTGCSKFIKSKSLAQMDVPFDLEITLSLRRGVHVHVSVFVKTCILSQKTRCEHGQGGCTLWGFLFRFQCSNVFGATLWNIAN
ncbi:MAG: hypothetical protein WBY44_21840 [Bryobacteraceae bacterium]